MPRLLKLSGRRIAMLATDGFEQSELTAPKRPLGAAGAWVDVIAPAGASEIKGWDKKNCGDLVKVDVPLKNAQSQEDDALVLPGGVMNPDKPRLEPSTVAKRPIADAH